mmetsp:Transcript_41464/g.114229  ORF Transcript_41464/g.114229 Transcript_41464/m.114229 type:complete len:207 (+) Transcript_41464:782-1402(+)
MPRPRDFPEGFMIHAFLPPWMECCLLFASNSFTTASACFLKCWPRGHLKSDVGAQRGTSSSSSLFFAFFFGFFLLSSSFRSRSVSRSTWAVVFFLISSSNSLFCRPPIKRCCTSSRFTCSSTAHSLAVTAPSCSAISGQSMTSSGSVTKRMQILIAKRTTSKLKVIVALSSMFSRNRRNTDSAFVNLKFATNSSLSRGSYKSKARG